MSIELKPCPFCGGSKIEDCYDDGLHWIKCKDCGATGPANTRYADEDDTDWNTRTLNPRDCPSCGQSARGGPHYCPSPQQPVELSKCIDAVIANRKHGISGQIDFNWQPSNYEYGNIRAEVQAVLNAAGVEYV